MSRSGGILRHARRKAGLTQRELSRRTGVAQSTVARIERGDMDPRATTLRRLVRECGFDLDLVPVVGSGVDRTQIRDRLRETPSERVARAGAEWEAVKPLRGAARPRA